MTIKSSHLMRWLWVGLFVGIISVWTVVATLWIQNRQALATATTLSNYSTVVSMVTVASRSSDTDIPPTATITGITATPYPTDYPLAKQTLEWSEMLTRQAAFLLPPPPPGAKEISTLPPSTRRYPVLPKGTPAGNGVITINVGSFPGSMGFDWDNSWAEIINDDEVIVHAGLSRIIESQGMVIVVRYGNGREYPFSRYYTPLKAGSVHIVGAQGERLILLSKTGVTFYFDVAGERFVNSLTEVVPSVTPGPTLTPLIVYTYTRRPTSTSTPVR